MLFAGRYNEHSADHACKQGVNSKARYTERISGFKAHKSILPQGTRAARVRFYSLVDTYLKSKFSIELFASK